MADVGCAGIIVADTFCGPMRALPHPGELLAVDDMPVKAGGCAANVAIDLAKQDISVEVIGCVGKDASAQLLLSCFAEAGVGRGRVLATEEFPTSKTVILLVEGEDRRYIHLFGANRAFRVAQIDRQWARSLKVFYLGGLFAMPGLETRALAELLAECRKAGVVTVIDVVLPKGVALRDLDALLPHVDYFLPNHDEARQLTGLDDPAAQAQTLCGKGVGTTIVTLAGDGAVACRGHKLWRCPAHAGRVIDPSGSGDAFAAGVITGILQGADMPEMLNYAAALGLSATSALGTTDGVFTAKQAAAFMALHPLTITTST